MSTPGFNTENTNGGACEAGTLCVLNETLQSRCEFRSSSHTEGRWASGRVPAEGTCTENMQASWSAQRAPKMLCLLRSASSMLLSACLRTLTSSTARASRGVVVHRRPHTVPWFLARGNQEKAKKGQRKKCKFVILSDLRIVSSSLGLNEIIQTAVYE